jgi:hypothetical protein
MPRLNYQLKYYIKAVERIAKDKKLARVVITPTKGSIVRFELFEEGIEVPKSIWTIHHGHDRRQEIWSKDDYRKASVNLNCTLEDFIKEIRSL